MFSLEVVVSEVLGSEGCPGCVRSGRGGLMAGWLVVGVLAGSGVVLSFVGLWWSVAVSLLAVVGLLGLVVWTVGGGGVVGRHRG